MKRKYVDANEFSHRWNASLAKMEQKNAPD